MIAPQQSNDSADVVAWLSLPTIYPDATLHVELRETHISWVFLTERHAYKLKKPVRFEFLDFSTVEARRVACEAEVRLNRRLAPDVYLGVVPIVRDATGKFQFGGHGDIVDYVVQMRRLPAERTLEAQLKTKSVQIAELDRIVTLLVTFYRALPAESSSAAEYRREIFQHASANRVELLKSHLATVVTRRVHNAQLQLLQLRPELFEDRVRAGRIVEGHGDLRPEHVYLTEPPVIIDCLEFNRELRTLDELDELCFLAMECDALDATHAGERILHAYGVACGDHPLPELVAFYKSYRACVRAKVALLRANQLAAKSRTTAIQIAGRYLQLGDAYLAPHHRPRVIVVGGFMGSGKTTLASALSAALGAEHLQTDAIRQELFGLSMGPADFGTGHYTPERKARVYDELFRRASLALDQGVSVILDGTFLKESQRDRAKDLAQARDLPEQYVECECPAEVAQLRIAARTTAGKSLSEARPELLASQLAEYEPVLSGNLLSLDTTAPVEANLAQLFVQLRRT